MKKKILSLILAVVMLIPAVMTTSACAAEAAGSYKLTYNGTTVTVPGETTAPDSTVIDGKTVIAWTYDGKTVAVGDRMTLTGDTTLTPVTIDAPVTNEDVSFRLAEYKAGTKSDLAMRFTATLSRADYDKLASLGSVKLGMLITPADYVLMAGEFTKEALEALNTRNGGYVEVLLDGCYELTETDYIFAASLKSFSETTMKKNPAFASVMYATVTTASGHTFTVYGGFDPVATHGVMNAADSLLAGDTLSATQREWLSALMSAFEERGADLNAGGIFLNVDINTVTFPFLQECLRDGVVTEEELRAFVTQYAGTQITDLAFDVFCQISFTESDVWSDALDSYHRTEENGFEVDWKDELEHYHQLYEVYEIDPHAVWFDACRDVGLTSWLTVRMNDCHNPTSDNIWFRGEEHYIAKENGWMLGSAYGNQQICYNYAVEEVREWMLAYIEEQIMRYDVDGLELDFSREWFCFPYLDYLGSREHVEIMNGFIRDVNALVEAAEAKWGHDMKIKIKLMRDIEQNLTLGFDAETYYMEGLCDILGVAPRWATNDSDMPIDEWKAEFPNIEIHATITDLTWGKATSYETAASYAAAYLALGSDKINLYNYFSNPNRVPAVNTKLYNTAGSLKTLSGVARRAVVAYQDVTPHGYTQYKPLPARANGLAIDLVTGPVRQDELVYLVVAVDEQLKAGDLVATVNGHTLPFYGETEYAAFFVGSAYQYCYLLPAGVAKQLTQSISFSTAKTGLSITHVELVFGNKTVPSELNLSADEAVLAEDRWVLTNRWDFTSDLTDSVGGATVTPVSKYANTPTYTGGKIILNGQNAYTLDEAIEFTATDNFKVVIKGKFDFNIANGGAKRIFGSAQGVNSGINVIDLNMKEYGYGYAVSFSPKTNGWNSYVYLPDRARFDMSEEHVLTFLSYNQYLYIYMDGVLMCKRDAMNVDDFSFTEFLGCSYNGNATSANVKGEIDYIAIATYSDLPLSEKPVYDLDRDLAVQPETAEEALDADNWEILHRFDFDGSVKDSVGNASLTGMSLHNVAPTYTEDGKIILGGRTAYTFDTPITFSKDENFKIVVKAKFETSTTNHGSKRILGSAQGQNSGIYYIDSTLSQYGGYAMAFAPKEANFDYYMSRLDKTVFDYTEEHVLEFMYFDGVLYSYMDGELMFQKAHNGSNGFIFSELFGCSYGGANPNYNAKGIVDYLCIATLSDYLPEEEPVWDTDRDLAPSVGSAEEARTSENYEILHRFDFNGSVIDSVGGITATLDDVHKTVPTFEDGRVVLDGHTAYALSDPITLSAKDNFKIVVRGQFDMSAATGYGVKRIFGSASGQNSCVSYINLNLAEYGSGYGFALSPVTGAFGSYVLKPDKTKHDVTNGMHTLEFMQFDGQIYLYFDGELMASRAAKNGDSFRFTEFLGCTYDNSIAYNTVGTIDYITVGLLSKYLVSEAPVWDADADENEGEDPTPPAPTYPTTAGEAISSTLWENVNAWEFNGDLTNAAGGTTLTQMSAHSVAPTYTADGKIVLGGRTAYTFNTPITFSKTDNFKITLRGKFDADPATAGAGSKRILGSASGQNSGIYYINLPVTGYPQYGGYAMAFAPIDGFDYYAEKLDKATFDIGEEHLYEFMYFEGTLYTYVDGELLFKRTAGSRDFIFTELFGCSYGGNNANFNAKGEVDYLRIAVLPKQ